MSNEPDLFNFKESPTVNVQVSGLIHEPDQFFTAEQQARLAELMALWKVSLNGGKPLSWGQWAELNALVGAELKGTMGRAISENE